jgi:hypothetical protein
LNKPIVFHDETILTNYPIEIPFTEYSLDSVSCQWTNVASDTVIIINNNNELENYITCSTGSYPAVDFNQYSLLLVHGDANYEISTISKRLEQNALLEYELNIGVYLKDTAGTNTAQQWYVAVIVPKLSQNTVSLMMHYHEPKILMLTVDYMTNTFQGGTEFVFSNNSDTFTIITQYSETPVWGYLKLFYREINELLFHGTTIYLGCCGQMMFPDDLLAPTQFQLVNTNDTILPQNGFETVFNDYGHTYYARVWGAVQYLIKVREYLQSNPNQKVKISLYTPSLGSVDYNVAYWIIYLKK